LPSAAFFCRYRNLVERCFGKGKNARGSSTRYNKRSDNFLAAITLFSTHLRITAHEPAV
jgi:transposase